MYPDAQALRTATGEVICLVDTEHPDEVRKSLRDRPPRYHSLERVRLCIELETAGLPCLLVHASMLDPADLDRTPVKAVVVCGRTRRTSVEDDERLFALLRSARKPVLCLGGAQGLAATAWGGEIGSLRRIEPGEPDPDPTYVPGTLKEVGFTRVRILARDPIFDGLGDTVDVMQRHSSEVKTLPAGFILLAGTDICRVQAFRHRERPLYGLQFLPDRFDDRHPDGRRILQNFFAIAGIDASKRAPEARDAFRARTRARVRDVCEDPAELTRKTAPYVVLVDMESPESVASPTRGSGTGMTHAGKIARFRGRIEGELAGLPCAVVHYAEVQEHHFSSPHLRAVVLTGAASPSVEPMLRDLFAVIRAARVPILGICAGHQHIARAHGVGSASMRPLREGEKDPHPAYHPGMFKEWGFLPVKIAQRDPLFDGLPDSIIVQEYHVAEVRSLPDGFELLAGTEECEVQSFRRRDRPVYGIQFHAECYDDAHPDGRRVLQNFFRIATGDWPRFRGPTGTGHHAGPPLPTNWGPADILWRTELKGEGHSSPVNHGSQIFLTSAIDQGRTRMVMSIDARDGHLIWEKTVACATPGRTHAMNSFATPTCATDGERVVAFFGEAGLHGFALDGTVLWSRKVGDFPGPWGVAASPVFSGGLVIQNCDAQGDSSIAALHAKTGEFAWRTSRGEKPMGGWGTPVEIVVGGRSELIVSGETGLDAYDPATGRPLWTCRGFNGRGEPMPDHAHGMLFVLNGKAGDAYALRPGGTGDVSETHRVWRTPRPRVRDLASPIVTGDYLFAIDMKGSATTYDARSGKVLWSEKFPGAFSASPVESGGLVYINNEAGETLVLRPGPTPDLVARNSLGARTGECFRASLAPIGGRIYLRSNRALYCVGAR
jgi:GMP synthase-like glutamine amidotransferase/outer membrane protein assembly factor BamB